MMRTKRLVVAMLVAAGAMAVTLGLAACWKASREVPAEGGAGGGSGGGVERAAEAGQVPTWSREDMDFFLHGSMSSEFVPENVLRAMIKTYPDLFATEDLSSFGLIPDPAFGWPVGFSRGRAMHLAGLPAVGVNCAACHVAEVERSGMGWGGSEGMVAAEEKVPVPFCGRRVRVLGATSHFDADAFFGSVVVATFRTQDPANMKRFMAAYLDAWLPEADADKRAARAKQFEAAWDAKTGEIAAAMKADPGGAQGDGPGDFHDLNWHNLEFGAGQLPGGLDWVQRATSMLALFHNMRSTLHISDELPGKVPPPPGPGRNDAFGLLSAELFAVPMPPMPVKFGLVWNIENRPWVHWDGNTRSPLGRNLLASIGLGAPLIGKEAKLDLKLVQRQTMLTEKIRAPRYPWRIDGEAAARGAKLYEANCAACHSGVEDDRRLYAPAVVGTDPSRAELFTPVQAERFNKFLAEVKIEGYKPGAEPGLRSTQKYLAVSMAGVWARSPYLHNGSVRTMAELLTPPAARPASFHRGSRVYDEAAMGYTDAGTYVFDTKVPGNGNGGHDYGTGMSAGEKRDLVEYLKGM